MSSAGVCLRIAAMTRGENPLRRCEKIWVNGKLQFSGGKYVSTRRAEFSEKRLRNQGQPRDCTTSLDVSQLPQLFTNFVLRVNYGAAAFVSTHIV